MRGPAITTFAMSASTNMPVLNAPPVVMKAQRSAVVHRTQDLVEPTATAIEARAGTPD